MLTVIHAKNMKNSLRKTPLFWFFLVLVIIPSMWGCGKKEEAKPANIAPVVLVLTNVGTADKIVKINGAGQPSKYKVFRTSTDDDCKTYGELAASDVVFVPAQGVVTLYSGN